jgi:RimJ/RimL family protein N-acetyltransferase
MKNTEYNWQPENLENEILKLIPLKSTDFDRLFTVAADPLIWEQHPTKDRYKQEVFKRYFDGAVASNTAFLIFDKANDQIIGSTRYYDHKPENSSIAIGYTFLAKKYWGSSYNKACKKLLLAYAFRFVDKIYFHIGASNLRSQKAIEKIGASKIGEIDFDYYGSKLLHFEYMISKKDLELPK